MQIHYFGLSSFKFIGKETTVVTDPFDKKSGLTPPRGNADIIILAEKNNPLYSATSGLSGEPFIMNDPGEYDYKGVTVTGIPLKQSDGRYVTVFLIETEDVKTLNLTHIKEFSMSEDELEALGEIDILILPVGGEDVLDATTASKIVNQVEPKIVIPSHYKIPGLSLDSNPIDKFIKEMGGKSEPMEKLIIKKKDLATEDVRVITLEPLR
ncbi:MAG: MBL fold metallo-hydrolase [Candidatus Doudnabacteria bacterium]|nr:MBL fold metallo-hydrolase [Candidatus Doudnabacteria bacterium]